MGQDNSTFVSPIELKAKHVVTAVRDAAAIAFLRDPLPTRPSDTQPPEALQTLWDGILAAEGADNLNRAVRRFLRHWTVDDLLAAIARENNESESAAQVRFALRYGDGGDRTEDSQEQARLLSTMLRDELDLPGFRVGTALRRWRRIIAQASELNPLDEEGFDRIRTSIFGFLHDHGAGRLMDCLQEDHASEPGVQEALSAIIDVDPSTGERILYARHPMFQPGYHQIVARNVRNWLAGEDQLSFDRFVAGSTPSKAAWADALHDEPIPKDDHESRGTIWDARRTNEWDLVYRRNLRHIDLFGIEDLVEWFFGA